MTNINTSNLNQTSLHQIALKTATSVVLITGISLSAISMISGIALYVGAIALPVGIVLGGACLGMIAIAVSIAAICLLARTRKGNKDSNSNTTENVNKSASSAVPNENTNVIDPQSKSTSLGVTIPPQKIEKHEENKDEKIQHLRLKLEELRKENSQVYPDYLDELLDNGAYTFVSI